MITKDILDSLKAPTPAQMAIYSIAEKRVYFIYKDSKGYRIKNTFKVDIRKRKITVNITDYCFKLYPDNSYCGNLTKMRIFAPKKQGN